MERAAAQARRAADRIGYSLPGLAAQLRQVNRKLQRVERAMKAPEKALEAIVREVGTQAAKLALSALPRALHLPVQLAVHAIERALDLGRDLGLGR